VYIIGENIQIISNVVRKAVGERDAKPLQELAKMQVARGAQMIDLNIGRRKKDGHEVMPWLVEAIHEVVPNAALSLDTTNAAAIEAGLKRCRELGIEALINSTSADPERLEATMPLAAEYGSKIIALTMMKSIPATADGRVQLAMEVILPKAMELGIPMENVYLDPLVMTVKGMQEHAMENLNAIRMFKILSDPPPMTVVGLSNVSNSVPHENRSLISTVTVKSGDTVMLGGLIRENTNSADTGIPLLHDLPLIGALFGQKANSTQRTELVIMMRPSIAATPAEARKISEDIRRKFQILLRNQKVGIRQPRRISADEQPG